MKRLHLLRHGKSSWDDLSLNDIDRPLKKRGMRNCADMAKLLINIGDIPELIICSPALRAFESARIMADEFCMEGHQFVVDEKLYMPDFTTLLRVALYMNNEIASVMIVGHEPSFSQLINHFLQNAIERITTASLTTLTFNTSNWQSLTPTKLEHGLYRDRHNMIGVTLR